jgi:hypothetical protein
MPQSANKFAALLSVPLTMAELFSLILSIILALKKNPKGFSSRALMLSLDTAIFKT